MLTSEEVVEGVPFITSHMSISLDRLVAGPDQSADNPLGIDGRKLHDWHLNDPKRTVDEALTQRPIDIAGGASAVRQALQARGLSELVLDIIPVVLRDGERLFDDVPVFHAGFVEAATSPLTTHIVDKIT